MKYRAILVLVVLVWLAVGAVAAEPRDFFQPVDPPRAYQVMVHRGLASIAPENTRAAIDRAIEDGLEWVEIDVRLTKDGQHVVFHDAKLDGKTNGHGAVKDHTLAELKQLDAGGWFAKRFTGAKLLSLDEVLAHAKGKINLYLDCKDVDPAKLVEEIQHAGMQRQVLVFDNRAKLAQVTRLSGGAVAVMPKWHLADGFGDWLGELKPAAVEIDADETSSAICRQFHERGIKVQAKVLGQWDNPKFWDKVLADGVDYLQTDLPEEIIAHVTARTTQGRHVKLACHRGASRYAPENTLPAFAKANRLHADLVEFDVRPSSDGKFFLLHDGKLDRTTTGKGPIRALSAEAIGQFDAGGWFARAFASTRVPTLDAFLSAVPEGMTLYFDAKDIPPAELAAAVTRHHLAARTIVYQRAEFLQQLQQIDSQIRALPPADSTKTVTALAQGLKPFAVDTPWRVLSKEYIDHCHGLGIQVFADAPFTADVKSYRQAIAWGIDVIQTDYPLRFWRAVELEQTENSR